MQRLSKTALNGCGKDTIWGIKVNNEIYPGDFTDSVPGEFKQEGLKVYVKFDTIIYPFACPCCYDGPYARIISIRKK